MTQIAEPRILILATSLNPQSRSRVLGRYAHSHLTESGIDAEWIDLRELAPLPMAGSPEGWSAHESLDFLKTRMKAATHLLFAVPIYNFSASAVTKNVIELMGADQLGGKTVGFLCSAGGPRSYMGILPLANALMLDFRCWIVPRFVYAVGGDVADGAVVNEEVQERIRQLTSEMMERTPPLTD